MDQSDGRLTELFGVVDLPTQGEVGVRSVHAGTSPSVSPATGQNPLSFVLTNRGVNACVLDGYPTVALLDARGKRLPFRISHSGDQMVTPHPPVAVRVLPRRSAFFVLNKYRCDLGDGKVVKRLRLGLPGVHTSARLTVMLPTYGVIAYWVGATLAPQSPSHPSSELSPPRSVTGKSLWPWRDAAYGVKMAAGCLRRRPILGS